VSPALAAMLQALKTTEGNILSLYGVAHAEVQPVMTIWLRVVREAIALGETQ
jgi:hypothetical protein